MIYGFDDILLQDQEDMEIPSISDYDYYEDFPQLENGVGLWKSLESEFDSALEEADIESDSQTEVSLATGVAAYPLLNNFKEKIQKKFNNVSIDVYAIENDFFGHSITVAGLVTGRDLINQLKGRNLHGRLIIPSVMLRSEGDVFLDDVSTLQVESELSVKLDVASNDGYELLDKILDIH